MGDGVGCRDVGVERKEHLRGLRELRDGNRLARKSEQGNGIQEGRRKPPLFAFADGFGIGGGARATGAAGGTASAAEMSA